MTWMLLADRDLPLWHIPMYEARSTGLSNNTILEGSWRKLRNTTWKWLKRQISIAVAARAIPHLPPISFHA